MIDQINDLTASGYAWMETLLGGSVWTIVLGIVAIIILIVVLSNFKSIISVVRSFGGRR